MRILVNFCIREVDKMGLKGNRKSCTARPFKDERHETNLIRRTINMKMAVEGSNNAILLG